MNREDRRAFSLKQYHDEMAKLPKPNKDNVIMRTVMANKLWKQHLERLK